MAVALASNARRDGARRARRAGRPRSSPSGSASAACPRCCCARAARRRRTSTPPSSRPACRRSDAGGHVGPTAGAARCRRSADDRSDPPVRPRPCAGSTIPGVPDARRGVRRGGRWRSVPATLRGRGPVHLNLPFREPLTGAPGELPPRARREPASAPVGTGWQLPRTVSPAVTPQAGSGAIIDRQRGVIVAGGRGGVPVAAHRGAGRRDGMAGARRPDQRRTIVASRGDDVRRACSGIGSSPTRHVAGGRRAHRPPARIESARPSGSPLVRARGRPGRRTGRRRSRARRRARVPRSTISSDLRGATGTTWAARWRHAEKRALEAIEAVAGRRRVAHRARRGARRRRVAPREASSSSWRPRCPCATSSGSGDRVARAHANRGANGIDGVVSTALGRALTGTPTVVLVGDIAFVHDSNALVASPRPGGRPADRRRRQRRRWHLLVPPPGDGAPRRSVRDPARHAARHRHRRPCPRPRNRRHDDHRCGANWRSVSTQPGPWLVRVPTNRADNVVVHDRLNAAVAAALG